VLVVLTSIFREGVGLGVLVGFGSGFLVLVAACWGLEVLVAGFGGLLVWSCLVLMFLGSDSLAVLLVLDPRGRYRFRFS
jgi:hypothetical protein